jgi:putative membrane protein
MRLRFRYMPAVITLLVIAIATGMVDAQARAAGPAQPALGPVDLYFVTQTSLGTPFQVDSGQLAEEKGGTQAIRSYAELMVSSHEAVNGALQAILQRKGPLPPPTLLQAAYATIVSTLQGEAGPAFDQDYVRGQVDYQKANAALYQYEIANGSDADLVSFGRETLPKIQDHLAKALALEPDAGH